MPEEDFQALGECSRPEVYEESLGDAVFTDQHWTIVDRATAKGTSPLIPALFTALGGRMGAREVGPSTY